MISRMRTMLRTAEAERSGDGFTVTALHVTLSSPYVPDTSCGEPNWTTGSPRTEQMKKSAFGERARP